MRLCILILSQRSLHASPLIEIHVGVGNPPFFIQQAFLEATSDFFIAALRPHMFEEGKAKRLDFPEDDLEAWGVLLVYILQRRVPCNLREHEELCTRCWQLGDAYSIPEFRDQAMIHLVSSHRTGHVITRQAATLGLKVSAPNSKMRRLVAEELAFKMKEERASGRFVMKDLEETIDGQGMPGEYLLAVERLKDGGRPREFQGRTTGIEVYLNVGRLDFLVGKDLARQLPFYLD